MPCCSIRLRSRSKWITSWPVADFSRIRSGAGCREMARRWRVSLNAPFDPVLEAPASLRLYVVDLYARDGNVPDGLEAAAERKSDLTFGNQTFQRLRHALEARQLRAELQGRDRNDRIYLLSYRPGREEAGPEKSFDLSERPWRSVGARAFWTCSMPDPWLSGTGYAA